MNLQKARLSIPREYIRNALIFASIFFFVFSIFQPAFFIDREDSNAYSDSLILFALGRMTALGGGAIPFLIWLANPFYMLSLYLISRKSKFGVVTILVSIILSIVFSNLKEIITSEAGSTSKILELGTGYYLWTVSFIVLLLAAIVNLFENSKYHIEK